MVLASLIGYLLLIIVLAKICSSRIQGLSDFFLANRSLPSIAIALTFVASWFGAGSSIGTMTHAFSHGLNAAWLILIPAFISCLIITFFIAQKVRQLDSLSQPEAVESCYGSFGRFLLAWIILASVVTLIASQLVAAKGLLEMTLGFSSQGAVGVMLGAIILYSIIGGFRAVVITDLLQFVFFTTAVLILLGFGLVHLEEFSIASKSLSSEFWSLTTNLKKNLFVTFTFVLAWSIAPEMWQRMAATKHANDAKKSMIQATSILTVLYLLVISAGILAMGILKLDDATAQTNVLVALAQQLPIPFLAMLVYIGLISAITSTIDSSLNVGSLTLTHDIIQRYIWKTASKDQLVFLSRMATVLIGIPAIAIALHYQDIIEVLWISADIYASSMFVPIVGLFYFSKAGKWSGILAMIFGIVPVLLSFLLDFHVIHLSWPWLMKPYVTPVGVGFSIVGFVVGSYLSQIQNKKAA